MQLSYTAKSLLGSKWLLSFVEESRPNWCLWQNAHQLWWSQDFTCMCPQEEKKTEVKISAANFSTAKMILLRAFYWRPILQESIPSVMSQVGGKSGTLSNGNFWQQLLRWGKVRSPILPSLGTLENNHFSVQSDFFEGVGFQLSQLQRKPLMFVNVNFYNNDYNILQLEGAPSQSISHHATTRPATQRWAELDMSCSCRSPICGPLRVVVEFSPVSKPQVKSPQCLELRSKFSVSSLSSLAIYQHNVSV